MSEHDEMVAKEVWTALQALARPSGGIPGVVGVREGLTLMNWAELGQLEEAALQIQADVKRVKDGRRT